MLKAEECITFSALFGCIGRHSPPSSSSGTQGVEAAATRALLLAFLTSQAVLWLLPADGLVRGADTALLRRLRMAQQLKATLLPGLPPLLGVPSAQASALRPGLCIPQLLVLAHAAPAALWNPHAGAGSEVGGAAAAAAAAGAEAPHQAWAARADHRLRSLLKRCRVLQPEDSARALCTLPSTSSLLLLLPEQLDSGDQTELVAAALADLSLPGPQQAVPAGSKATAPTAAAVVAAALAPQRAAVSAGMAGSRPGDLAQTWQQAVATLAAVLEAAALKASSSSGEAGAAGQDQAAPVDVAVPPEAASAAAWQGACGDGLRQFSLASCKRAAAVAADAYRRNTPALLPAAGHAVALQVRAMAGALLGGRRACLASPQPDCPGGLPCPNQAPPHTACARLPCTCTARRRCACTAAWPAARRRQMARALCRRSWTPTGQTAAGSATPCRSWVRRRPPLPSVARGCLCAAAAAAPACAPASGEAWRALCAAQPVAWRLSTCQLSLPFGSQHGWWWLPG